MAGIKICGIRRQCDIEYVNSYLPEYIGFVFAESRRRVSPEEAGRMSSDLEGGIRKAGVFVDEEAGRVSEIALSCGLDAVQLHGGETAEYLRGLRDELGKGVEIWKTVRVRGPLSAKALQEIPADRIVLDTYSPSVRGGTGKAFDWSRAEGIRGVSLILAGGLDSKNAARAVSLVKPFMVDVSSGVETDGFKDRLKIRDFIYAVRKSYY